MLVTATAIPDVKLVTPRRHGDSRGWFSETYNRRALAEQGIEVAFVQDNQSYSREAGVLRGLHFQLPPFAQAKLVRVLRGRVLDVAVDLRRRSPTFGRHVAVELSAEDGVQLFIPVGFAHGFLTLEAETEVFYKVSAHYAPEHDSGIRYDDPEIGISWPLPEGREPILSPKDAALPSLAETRDRLPF